MENSDKFVVILVSLAVFCIFGVTFIVCTHIETMARLGYTQTTLPGVSETVWVK